MKREHINELKISGEVVDITKIEGGKDDGLYYIKIATESIEIWGTMPRGLKDGFLSIGDYVQLTGELVFEDGMYDLSVDNFYLMEL